MGYLGAMTKNHSTEAPDPGALAKIIGGINAHLSDHTAGRRDVAWLSDRTGIPRTTLYRKLANPQSLTFMDVLRIADAFDVPVADLYEVAA